MITENETFLYAHHTLAENSIPNNELSLYMYFNFGYESFSTTDYQLLASMANSAISGAILKETLQSSGSLIGLSVGMSMGSPSITAVMLCLTILSIEMSSVTTTNSIYKTYSYIPPTTQTDATVPGDIYRSEKYCFRKIDTSKPYSDRARQIGTFLFKSSAAFLLSFYLFDEMKKKMPITDSNSKSYYNQFFIASNIALTVLKNSSKHGMSFIRSYAGIMCPSLLQISSGRCGLRKSGTFQYMTSQSEPIKRVDKNIHNVLFVNSRYWFTNQYTYRQNNNYISLLFSYMFYSQLSNFEIYSKFISTLRKTKIDNEFYDYLFDSNITTNNELLSKLSQDSIQYIIDNVQQYDSNVTTYDNDAIIVYNELVNTAKQICTIFKNYFDNMKDTECAIKYPYIMSSSEVTDIQQQIVNLNSTLTLNPKAKYNPGEGLVTKLNDDMLINTEQYQLIKPILSTFLDNATLNSGFFKYYKILPGTRWIRQYAIYNTFCQANKLATILKNEYDQNIGLIELTEPKQDQQKLYLTAMGDSNGSLDCLKNYNQIPKILAKVVPQYSIRGLFSIVE